MLDHEIPNSGYDRKGDATGCKASSAVHAAAQWQGNTGDECQNVLALDHQAYSTCNERPECSTTSNKQEWHSFFAIHASPVKAAKQRRPARGSILGTDENRPQQCQQSRDDENKQVFPLVSFVTDITRKSHPIFPRKRWI